MAARAKPKAKSAQLARQTCLGLILRGERSRETKPVSRLRIANFGLRIGNKPAARRPIVQNEANLARRLQPRRTKCAKRTQFPAAEMPHHSNIPLFQHPNPMPIVQNEPNLPPDRQAGPWLEPIVQNEPNFRSAGRLGTPNCAKQSQKAVVGSQ